MATQNQSGRLAPEDLVDIVYAVVIGAGFFEFKDVLLRPQTSFAAFFALIAVYVTVAWSWYGYHKSMTAHPYKELAGHARLVIDFLILVIYVFLLLSVREIQDSMDAVRYTAAFPAMFLGYIVSGLLRMREHGKEASRMPLLFIVFVTLIVLSIGIGVWTFREAESHEGLRVGVAIGATLFVTIIYRIGRHATKFLTSS